MKHFTYLLLDAFTLLGPLGLSFDRKVTFHKNWKYLWAGMLPTAVFFLFWDVLFTQWGVWSFNDEYLIGIRLLNLPLEEWLFFLVVPYACTFIYSCLRSYGRWTGEDAGRTFFLILSVLLTTIGGFYWEKAYTAFAFMGCGAGCLLVYASKKWLPTFRYDAFLWAYAICLLPFFLVNGVLTALPVVIYNDAENLAVRLYTIPVEDTFYGMLMVLGNVVGMEWLRGRDSSKSIR